LDPYGRRKILDSGSREDFIDHVMFLKKIAKDMKRAID
jgi:hypothetical protein